MTRAARAGLGWQKAALALALVVFALALAGLWSTAAPADGTIARTSKTVAVEIADFKFTPAAVRVSKGSSVRFSNSSGITHTATSGGAFDTGRIRSGRSVTVRFTQKGTFAYHCTIHPFMKGKVVVD